MKKKNLKVKTFPDYPFNLRELQTMEHDNKTDYTFNLRYLKNQLDYNKKHIKQNIPSSLSLVFVASTQ